MFIVTIQRYFGLLLVCGVLATFHLDSSFLSSILLILFLSIGHVIQRKKPIAPLPLVKIIQVVGGPQDNDSMILH
jgi:hypothetical protein